MWFQENVITSFDRIYVCQILWYKAISNTILYKINFLRIDFSEAEISNYEEKHFPSITLNKFNENVKEKKSSLKVETLTKRVRRQNFCLI